MESVLFNRVKRAIFFAQSDKASKAKGAITRRQLKLEFNYINNLRIPSMAETRMAGFMEVVEQWLLLINAGKETVPFLLNRRITPGESVNVLSITRLNAC